MKRIIFHKALLIFAFGSLLYITSCRKDKSLIEDLCQPREATETSVITSPENDNDVLVQTNIIPKVRIIGKAVISEQQISRFDNRYIGFIRSDFLKDFNKKKFKKLNFAGSKIVSFNDKTQAIFIPTVDTSKMGAMVGYLDPKFNQKVVFGLVSQVEKAGGVSIISYFQPNGDLEVKLTVLGKKILNIDVAPEASFPGTCTFKNCYREARKACSESFACELACAILNVACPIGTAACCAIEVASKCTGEGCN